jgi:hypothetical protein
LPGLARRDREGFDLSHFGSAPTKFDEADLYPLTARHLHETLAGGGGGRYRGAGRAR